MRMNRAHRADSKKVQAGRRATKVRNMMLKQGILGTTKRMPLSKMVEARGRLKIWRSVNKKMDAGDAASERMLNRRESRGRTVRKKIKTALGHVQRYWVGRGHGSRITRR